MLKFFSKQTNLIFQIHSSITVGLVFQKIPMMGALKLP